MVTWICCFPILHVHFLITAVSILMLFFVWFLNPIPISLVLITLACLSFRKPVQLKMVLFRTQCWYLSTIHQVCSWTKKRRNRTGSQHACLIAAAISKTVKLYQRVVHLPDSASFFQTSRSRIKYYSPSHTGNKTRTVDHMQSLQPKNLLEDINWMYLPCTCSSTLFIK